MARIVYGVERPRRDVLLDTGPLVATLDAADQWHHECAADVVRLAGRCVTTEAVVTEACHLVARGGARPALVLEFLLEAEIPVLSLDLDMLRRAAHLMDRYASVPMDFADAALVTLADGLGLTTALTVDRRGFHAYRTGLGKRFRLVPDSLR